MTTSIDIANRALVLLGGREITSFVDSSTEARIAKNLYQSTRDYTLRAYPWGCLKKRVELVELVDKPISVFLHQYQLPTDSVRTLEVHSPQVRVNTWEVNGDLLLTDTKPISIVYLSNTVPEENWSSQLVTAAVYRLASEMAYPMTGNPQAQVNFNSLFQNVIDEARTTDALEQSYRPMGTDMLARVRH